MVDMGGWCIDSTEVTQSQYQAFLVAKGGDVGGQPSACSWNTSYAPATSGNQCTPSTFSYTVRPNHPIGCVDHCDAMAFCSWAGKRLCGRTSGGGLTPGSALPISEQQWRWACSNGGTTTYPYGALYVPETCNDDTSGPVIVASMRACHGTSSPFSSLYDMAGNVSEWIDSCTADGTYCALVGGDYPATDAARCNFEATFPRAETAAYTGFRCCSL
jgi:formylglycine-generating enzyme